jgi:hypothetical protein
MDHPYVYVFVRTDISYEQQLVQASHACFEAGIKFNHEKEQCSIVMIGIKNKEKLLQVEHYLKTNDVDYSMFFEPDFDMGESAIATRPMRGNERKLFKKFQLYKSNK